LREAKACFTRLLTWIPRPMERRGSSSIVSRQPVTTGNRSIRSAGRRRLRFNLVLVVFIIEVSKSSSLGVPSRTPPRLHKSLGIFRSRLSFRANFIMKYGPSVRAATNIDKPFFPDGQSRVEFQFYSVHDRSRLATRAVRRSARLKFVGRPAVGVVDAVAAAGATGVADLTAGAFRTGASMVRGDGGISTDRPPAAVRNPLFHRATMFDGSALPLCPDYRPASRRGVHCDASSTSSR